MHIDTANLYNLTQLWQHYGARTLYKDDQLQLHKNISWPNRVWADMATPVAATSLEQTAKAAPSTARFPLWPAMTKAGSAASQQTVDALIRQSENWQQSFQHTAMALELSNYQSNNVQDKYPIHVAADIDIDAWVETGSKAFGYTIDKNVFAPLQACEDMQILLGYNEDSAPVATGLLFKTDSVVGIHQIGVPAEHQGKGYATQMMRFLIQYAQQWQAEYAVLQASAAGKPVYQKLGFVEQFMITYLQRCGG